jgi:hypothetical protein
MRIEKNTLYKGDCQIELFLTDGHPEVSFDIAHLDCLFILCDAIKALKDFKFRSFNGKMVEHDSEPEKVVISVKSGKMRVDFFDSAYPLRLLLYGAGAIMDNLPVDRSDIN